MGRVVKAVVRLALIGIGILLLALGATVVLTDPASKTLPLRARW